MTPNRIVTITQPKGPVLQMSFYEEEVNMTQDAKGNGGFRNVGQSSIEDAETMIQGCKDAGFKIEEN